MRDDPLHLDFESRSTVDLKKAGADVYARHPSTEAVCMAWAFGDGPVSVGRFVPTPFTLPADLERAINDPGVLVYAHNATFERLIWNHVLHPRFGWPKLPIARTRCTMAMAYAMALPGALEDAAAALGLDVRKDMAGRRLMLQMDKPRRIDPDGTPVWWDDDDRMGRLMEYCRQDVVVERALHGRLLELPS